MELLQGPCQLDEDNPTLVLGDASMSKFARKRAEVSLDVVGKDQADSAIEYIRGVIS